MEQMELEPHSYKVEKGDLIEYADTYLESTALFRKMFAMRGVTPEYTRIYFNGSFGQVGWQCICTSERPS